MARSQFRSNRKVTGGRYHSYRTKKRNELSGFAANTKLGERRAQTKRILGGHIKQGLLSANEISVTDKKGKSAKTTIINVVENPANSNLVRRNIITKGCVVETKMGRARVTSRPGQEGSVSGKLL